METRPDSINLTFAALTAEGCFLDLRLPAGQSIVGENWSGDDDTLHVLGQTGGGAELGLVPLAGYDGSPVRVGLTLGPAAKSVLAPPRGPRNEVMDLTATDLGGGKIALQWTEVNLGDYDFNGEVNAADLGPLARFFLEKYDRELPGARNTTHYWVDGDGNGEINAADIAPLARHFMNAVAGYRILRNGVVLGTIPASDGLARQGHLPRLHSFEASGLLGDTWRVEVVDHFGEVGASSIDGTPIDLKIEVESSGPVELLGGWKTMRVYLPGRPSDRVKGTSSVIEPLSISDGTAQFSGIPRGEPLCVEFTYIPARDLATGALRSGAPDKDGNYPADWYVATRIPFVLPAGTAALSIDATLAFQPNPAGGWFIDLHTTRKQGSAPSWGSYSRLDYAAGQLAYDSDGDGSLTDEPWLADTERTSVSDSYLDRLLLERELLGGGVREHSVVKGTLAAPPSLDGTLLLDSAVEYRAGQAMQALSDGASVRFTELAEIHSLVPGQGMLDIDPFSLPVGTPLSLQVQHLQPSAGGERFADVVQRRDAALPADMLYAVPETEIAYPGQSVRVTVFAQQTAGPLRDLNSVRLTYPAGCNFRAGSFNVGAPGGARWDVDGVWSAIAPSGFNEDLFIEEQGLGGGLNALTVSVRPLNGTPVAGLSGALFNFELVVGVDCTLGFQSGQPHTFYSDGSGGRRTWTHDTNLGWPGIRVVGERPVLVLTTPPTQGSGTLANPYVIQPGAEYDFTLLHGGVDVSAEPETLFSVAPPTAGVFSGPRLAVAPGFSGALQVSGSYRGIPVADSSVVHMRTPTDYSISLLPDIGATFRYGGAGTLSLQTLEHPGGMVEARVLVSNAVNLRGAFFRLNFDPGELSFDLFDSAGDFATAANGELVEPTVGMLTPYMTSGFAQLSTGLVLRRPQEKAGFSAASGIVASVWFRQPDTAYGTLPETPPSSVGNRPRNLRFNGPNTLLWEYNNLGDYDQNGSVGISDLNVLAANYNETSDGPPGQPFFDTSIEHVVDSNAPTGLIDSADRGAIETNFGNRVSNYRIYGSNDSSAWPDPEHPASVLVAEVPFTQAQGDRELQRVYFQQSIAEAPQLDYYWVIPEHDGLLGIASEVRPR